MATNTQTYADDILPAKKEGVTIKELVRRHLTDEKHTTTDEELQNVKLSFYQIDEVNKRLN